MNSRQASLSMIAAACLWGTHPTLIKLANWTPYGTAWVRGISCAIFLGLFLAYRRQISVKSLWVQMLCGLFLAVNSLLFVSASALTTPANAVLLMFSFPWITMGLDFYIRGLRPLPTDIVRLCIGFLGIMIIVAGSHNFTDVVADTSSIRFSGTLGDICALLAGLSIALHIFFSQKLHHRHQGNDEILTSMMIGWVLTSVVLLPASLSSAAPNAEQWGYLSIFGLLSALPWLLWGVSIAHIPGHVVAALLGVEVFVAALLGWLVLNEAPNIFTWVGGVLILGAATSQILSTNQQS